MKAPSIKPVELPERVADAAGLYEADRGHPPSDEAGNNAAMLALPAAAGRIMGSPTAGGAAAARDATTQIRTVPRRPRVAPPGKGPR